MIKIKQILILVVLLSISTYSQAQFWRIFKSEKDTTSIKKKSDSPYLKFIKKVDSQKGLFSIHTETDKKTKKITYFLELKDSLLNKDMLFGSKISESSDSKKAMAGQMQFHPKLIYFTRLDNKIFMHQKISTSIAPEGQKINISLKRNNIDPVLQSFKIEYTSENDSSYVIKVNDFFMSTKRDLGASGNNPVGRGRNRMTVNASASQIIQTQAFPKNINVKCLFSYYSGYTPISIKITRSIVLLRDKPMSKRLWNERMSYFKSRRLKYNQNSDYIEDVAFIHRWDLSPRKEDLEKYKQGQLVVPEKQIVFYLDDAFPLKWKKYIKLGIEDWQKTFEAIGFKDAIIAKDFPEDKDFNPEDIRFSCYRYITTPIANSMGPSWVDPRSGEIVQASVYFFHNLLKLVHNWRFVQTAAVDKGARTKVLSDEIMGEAIRYVASHEIGHTLGLAHNFASSHAFPVDSLRSVSFTNKYGTTPSVMDYARNNYVAQVGDSVTNLCPPHIGAYDMYAIKLGYKPVLDASESQQTEEVNKWINEKINNPIYKYGPQKRFVTDPSAQHEDLGDDVLKASKYGIVNVKIIMQNLVAWTCEKGDDYTHLDMMYQELLKQYYRFIYHTYNYIGSYYQNMARQGDGRDNYVAVSKKKQFEILDFIFSEFEKQSEWMLNKDVLSRIKIHKNNISSGQTKILKSLMSKYTCAKIANIEHLSDLSYKQYMDHLFLLVWKSSVNADKYKRNLQISYLNNIVQSIGAKDKSKNAYFLNNILNKDINTRYDANSETCTLCVNDADFAFDNINDQDIMLYSKSKSEIDNDIEREFFNQMKDIRIIVKRNMRSCNAKTKKHYEYILFKLNAFFE